MPHSHCPMEGIPRLITQAFHSSTNVHTSTHILVWEAYLTQTAHLLSSHRHVTIST